MEKARILLIDDRKDVLEENKADLISVPDFNDMFEFVNCEAFLPSDLSLTANTEKITRDEQKKRILETINDKIDNFDMLLIDYQLYNEEKSDLYISVEIVRDLPISKKIIFISRFGAYIGDDEQLKELSKRGNITYCPRYDPMSKNRPVRRCKGDYDRCNYTRKENPPKCTNLECFAQKIIDFYNN